VLSRIAGLELLSSEVSSDAVRLRYKLSAESPYFEGHFPAEPLFPGVAQLGLVLNAARLLGGPFALAGLRGVRFRRLLRPGDECEVSLARVEPASLRFEVRSAEGVAAAGVLEGRPAPSCG